MNENIFYAITYNENALEMFLLSTCAIPIVEDEETICIGNEVRTLFTTFNVMALHKVAKFGEMNLLDVVLVHCKSSSKPFYAILHRINVDFPKH